MAPSIAVLQFPAPPAEVIFSAPLSIGTCVSRTADSFDVSATIIHHAATFCTVFDGDFLPVTFRRTAHLRR